MSGPDPEAAPLVLIVDDDEGLLLLMTDALKAAGLRVARASSGERALQALRAGLPDLMLLDLKLRDLDAWVLLNRLEMAGISVPFVVVTGQGDERAAVAMMKRGALDYVMKDTSIIELLPAIVSRALTALERDRRLAEARSERDRLQREVLQISERERERFGADLHDGIGQRLTAIEMTCAGVRDDLRRSAPKLAGRVDEVMEQLRETIAETRALARGLAPLDEHPSALQSGLETLARHADRAGPIRVRIADLTPRSVRDREVAAQLFRIAQEAVNNALKHSHGREVSITLQEESQGLVLRVIDDGKGLPPGSPDATGLGQGIMRYRANAIGAELRIEPAVPSGLAVVCRLPVFP